MSNTSKTVIWVVVILVVLGGVWMLLDKPTDEYAVAPTPVATTSTDQSGAAMTGPTAANTSNAMVTNSNDTSDSSITSDSAAIDAQMKGLNSDSSASAPASDSQ